MSIEGLGQLGLGKVQGHSFIEDLKTKKQIETPPGGNFDGFLKAAIDTLNETSRLEQAAGAIQLDYITGKTDDMLAVVLAEQKAQVALNFTVQVTGKIIEAYKQIISMQM